ERTDGHAHRRCCQPVHHRQRRRGPLARCAGWQGESEVTSSSPPNHLMRRVIQLSLCIKVMIISALVCYSPVPALAQRAAAITAEQHFSRGVALLDKQQVDRALIELRMAIKLKPGFAEAHNMLGVALARKGDVRQAADAFRQAIALDPKHYKAERSLGRALQQLGDVDGAIASLRQSLDIKADEADTHLLLG